MSKTKKKLVTSMLLLVVALCFAGTSTYAWFSMNATPEVGSFDVNVTTGTDGLYISLNAGNEIGKYSSALSSDKIAGYISGQNVVLDNITSEDGITFKTEQDSDVSAEAGTVLAPKKYVSIPLKFKSATELVVKLNSNAGALVGNSITSKTGTDAPTFVQIVAWDSFAEDVYGVALVKGANITARAANAMRVSFANETDAKVWNPNADQGYKTGNLANDYKNHINSTTTTVSTSVATPSASIQDDILVTLVKDGDAFYGELTINLWIEGWDGDCFDSIYKDIISANFQFLGSAKPII